MGWRGRGGGDLRGVNLEQRPVKAMLQSSTQEIMNAEGQWREDGDEDTDSRTVWKAELAEGWCGLENNEHSRNPRFLASVTGQVMAAPTG